MALLLLSITTGQRQVYKLALDSMNLPLLWDIIEWESTLILDVGSHY